MNNLGLFIIGALQKLLCLFHFGHCFRQLGSLAGQAVRRQENAPAGDFGEAFCREDVHQDQVSWSISERRWTDIPSKSCNIKMLENH